jgi:ribosome-associated translation inhibitor RaiA
MRLQIRRRNLEVSPELRGSIERRLRFVLGRFGSRIGHVTVYLAECKSAHGTMGKRCRIVVRLLRSDEVSIDDTDEDLGAVVNRAMERVGPSVRRKLERQREEAGPWATKRHTTAQLREAL